MGVDMLLPRSFTFFAGRENLIFRGDKLFETMMDTAGRMSAAFAPPRTLRLTLPAISLDTSEDFEVDLALASRWYSKARESGFRWINQPLHLGSEASVELEKMHVITEMLSKNDSLFASINVKSIAQVENAAKAYSYICKSLSRSDFRGFSNFRFGIGFNIMEYTPFFPFSDGPKTGVSIGIESLPLIRKVWEETNGLDDVDDILSRELSGMESAYVGALGPSGPVEYHGADWSLAPLPNGKETVVGLIEHISGNTIGSGGSLAAIAALTRCLKSPLLAGIGGVGFNGVMLSVLEDDVLANRFRHREVSVNDLLLYSSVCGCGLDMVPLSGDTPEAAISEYAKDTAAMAFRLKKPLGVRFLPIASLKSGQETLFSHDFVCNSAVVNL
jgi:uncharacterized protein (UPF0210 family)